MPSSRVLSGRLAGSVQKTSPLPNPGRPPPFRSPPAPPPPQPLPQHKSMNLFFFPLLFLSVSSSCLIGTPGCGCRPMPATPACDYGLECAQGFCVNFTLSGDFPPESDDCLPGQEGCECTDETLSCIYPFGCLLANKTCARVGCEVGSLGCVCEGALRGLCTDCVERTLGCACSAFHTCENVSMTLPLGQRMVCDERFVCRHARSDQDVGVPPRALTPAPTAPPPGLVRRQEAKEERLRIVVGASLGAVLLGLCCCLVGILAALRRRRAGPITGAERKALESTRAVGDTTFMDNDIVFDESDDPPSSSRRSRGTSMSRKSTLVSGVRRSSISATLPTAAATDVTSVAPRSRRASRSHTVDHHASRRRTRSSSTSVSHTLREQEEG